MLPSSVIVIVATALFTLGAALVLGWAWKSGFLRDLDAQARVIFDERDWRLERPWETDTERQARTAQFGALVEPDAGEWGGAS